MVNECHCIFSWKSELRVTGTQEALTDSEFKHFTCKRQDISENATTEDRTTGASAHLGGHRTGITQRGHSESTRRFLLPAVKMGRVSHVCAVDKNTENGGKGSSGGNSEPALRWILPHLYLSLPLGATLHHTCYSSVVMTPLQCECVHSSCSLCYEYG